LSTRRSGVPSSLKSFNASAVDPLAMPVANVWAASNVPSPFPSRMLVLLPPFVLATARSGKPSPFQSPALTALGPDPAGTGIDGATVPSGTPPEPPPRSTLTELAPLLLTVRSAMPSAFRSATHIALGDAPTPYDGPSANVPSPFPPAPFPNSIRMP